MDPMSKMIDELLTEIDSLREQIERLKVEREEMKRTYDRRVEDLEKDYVLVRDNLLKSERCVAEYGAAINETLNLADFLNDVASDGAGFSEHWGERVLQAVEPLRNTKEFKDRTLEHNRTLLNYNSELLDRVAKLEAQAKDPDGYVNWLKSALGEQQRMAQAARIEGLREALKLMRQANFYAEGVELILAEIAALERGKEVKNCTV